MLLLALLAWSYWKRRLDWRKTAWMGIIALIIALLQRSRTAQIAGFRYFAKLIEKIAELLGEKKLPLIVDVRDSAGVVGVHEYLGGRRRHRLHVADPVHRVRRFHSRRLQP